MSIQENIQSIHENIKAAQDEAKINAQTQLIAVSKRQSLEKIEEALNAGQRIFGENRVQEAQDHWEKSGFKAQYTDLELHLVGPLQTNKVKDAVALFDVIEVVDREKLARSLAQEMKKQNRDLPCFIQVNTGQEPQKSGIDPEDLEDFVALCRDDIGLNVVGLMCIPPADEPAGLHFALLKKYAQDLSLPKLSMGMSADYEWAAALGADYVRVGTGVFGTRDH